MVPIWVAEGIEAAFCEWEEMSGEWLHTAPEYHVTVNVAQRLRDSIPSARRTLLMEPGVAKVIADAGGVQRGPKAKHLRHGGRFDIVLGHADGRPRVVIELKNPLYVRGGKQAVADLHRVCRALLNGKASTQLYAGVFAFYTSSAPPKSKDPTAKARLHRKWLTEWRPYLQSWAWAGLQKEKYEQHLRINIGARLHERKVAGETHAWAAVCVKVVRKPRKRHAASKRLQ